MLKETLRIYPTAPGTSRDIVEDMVIDGIRIPGGAICNVSHSLLSEFLPLKQEVCQNPKCFHSVFIVLSKCSLNYFEIQFNTYVTGRMDKFFKDPLTFDPDRFHPDAPKYVAYSFHIMTCLVFSLNM